MRKRLAPRSQESATQHVALIIEDEAQQPVYLQRAPPPKPPLFLPDKHYQAFLAGRPRRSSQGWLDGQKCARGCAGFSLIAILFLLFVAMLVERQPLYIKGVRPYSPTSDMTDIYSSSSSSKRHSVALAPVIVMHCHQAAVAYLMTMVISILYGWNVCWRIKALVRRRHYSDIPDASSTIPTFHAHDADPYHGNGGTGGFFQKVTRWRRAQRRKPKRG